MEAKDFAKLALLQDAANTNSTGQAILHYEGGTGTNSESNTSVTFPEFTIHHVIPFAVDSSTVVTVTQGNVYSYNGRYYVCIANYNAPAGWKSYENVIPDGNK